MAEEIQVNLEKFNTGAGYYGRVNYLLNQEAQAILEGNKTQRYHILWCIYLDLMPKCEKKEEDTMNEAFTEITQELSDKGGRAEKLPDSMLTQWSCYMRKLLDKKGMLTPKSQDPSRAMVGGF